MEATYDGETYRSEKAEIVPGAVSKINWTATIVGTTFPEVPLNPGPNGLDFRMLASLSGVGGLVGRYRPVEISVFAWDANGNRVQDGTGIWWDTKGYLAPEQYKLQNASSLEISHFKNGRATLTIEGASVPSYLHLGVDIEGIESSRQIFGTKVTTVQFHSLDTNVIYSDSGSQAIAEFEILDANGAGIQGVPVEFVDTHEFIEAIDEFSGPSGVVRARIMIPASAVQGDRLVSSSFGLLQVASNRLATQFIFAREFQQVTKR